MIVGFTGPSELYRLPTRRRRLWQQDLGGYARGYEQAPEAAATGAAVAASGSDGFWSRISVGVATGVLVFTVTKILDRAFFEPAH